MRYRITVIAVLTGLLVTGCGGNLQEKLAKPPRYSSEVKPEWCGNCDEVSRKLDKPVDIPNGNGSATWSCLKCDPYMVNKANGY